MKNRFHALIVFILSSLLLITLSSCENFGQGSKLKKEIEDKIKYEKADSCTIRILAADGTGTVVTGTEKTAKVTDRFKVSFKPASNHNFREWRAVSYSDNTISMADYINFIGDPESTEVEVELLKLSDDILLFPVCVKEFKVTEFSPTVKNSAEKCKRDSAIIFTFNTPIAPDQPDNLSNINISIEIQKLDNTYETLENPKDYYQDPIISEDKIIILPDEENMLPIAMGELAYVDVTLPSSIYYETSGVRIELAEDCKKSFIADYNTTAQLNVSYGLVDADAGSFRIDGVTDDGSIKPYSIGKTVTLTFKKTDDYYFTGWQIEPEDDYKSYIIFDYNEDTDYDEDTGTATATFKVLSSEETVTITPTVKEIPTYTLNITGSHGKFSPSKGSYTHKINEPVSLNYEADTGYCFINWKIDDNDPETESFEDYIIFDENSESPTFTVTKFPETIPENYTITLEAVHVERPQIISTTPTYTSSGVYRDARIMVMFDEKMDPDSIYYTPEELTTILDEEVTLLPEGGEKFYGYIDSKGDLHYRSVAISNYRNNVNLLDKFNVPQFETPTTLVISTKKGDAPTPGTQLLVSVSENLYKTVGAKQVSLTTSKKWNYMVNSHSDEFGPEWSSIKLYDSNENEFTKESSFSAYESDPTTTPIIAGGKLKVLAEINDIGDSGLESNYTVNIQKIADDKLEPCSSELITADIYFTTSSGTTAAICQDVDHDKIPGIVDLSDFITDDGIYTVSFNVYDLNKNPSTTVGPYYIRTDKTPPNVNMPSIVTQGTSEIYTEWINDAEADYSHALIKYKVHNSESEYTVSANITDENYLISGLATGTTYDLVFEYYDIAGNCKSFGPITKNTMPASIETIQTLVEAQDSNSVTLSWEKPAGNYAGAKIIYTQKENFNNGSYELKVPATDTQTQTTTISDLPYGNKYLFKLIAYDTEYDEDTSNTLFSSESPVVSTIIKPEAISNLAVTNIETTKISLSWRNPASDYSYVKITYGKTEAANDYSLNIEKGIYTKEISDLESGTQYFFKVYTVSYFNETEYITLKSEHSISETTLPLAPSFTAVRNTTTPNTAIDISWESVSGNIDGYYLYYGTSAEDISTLAGIFDTETTSSTITGLTAGAKYFVKVHTYVNTDKICANTTGIPVEIYTQPNAVTNFDIQYADDYISYMSYLTWEWPEEGDATGVIIFYGETPETENVLDKVTDKNQNYFYSWLNPGTRYYFRIATYSADNVKIYNWTEDYDSCDIKTINDLNSLNSNLCSTTKDITLYPEVPASVTASTLSESSIKIKWYFPSSGKVDGYYIYYGTSPDNVNTLAKKVDSITNEIIIENLTENEFYYAKVIAYVNTDAEYKSEASSISNYAFTRGGIAQFDTLTTNSATSITTTWVYPTSNYDGVKLYYKKNESSSWSLAETYTDKTTTTHNFTDLIPGTQYDFKLVTWTGTYISESSDNAGIATTAKTTLPTYVSSVNASQNLLSPTSSINVSWNAPSSGTVTGYYVYYGTDLSDISTLGKTVTTTSTTITDLAAGTGYYVKVVPYLTTEDTYIGSGTLTTSKTYTRPLAPINISFTNKKHDSVTVNWNNPTSGSFSGVKVFYSVDNSTWDLAATYTNTTTTSHIMTGLTPSTTYYFKISAYVYSSTLTDYQNDSTVASIRTTPGYVTNLSVTQATDNPDTSLTVTWTAAEGDCIGYWVNWGTSSSVSSMEFRSVSKSATSYTITGLTPGTKYYVIIETKTSSDGLIASPAASAYTQLNPATNITASVSNTTSINVSWTNPVGNFDKIRIYYKASQDSSWSYNDIKDKSTSYTISNATRGEDYYIYVYSYVDSVYTTSNMYHAYIEPDYPRNVYVSTDGNTTSSLNVTWNAPASGTVGGYKVYYGTSYALSNMKLYNTYSSATTSCTISGLTAGTKYYVSVLAYTINKTSLTNYNSYDYWYTKPNAVTVTPSTTSTTSVTLNWSYSSTGSTSGVSIYKKLSSESNSAYQLEATTTGTSYTVTGLTAGTPYTFKVVPYYNRTTNTGADSTVTYGPKPNEIPSYAHCQKDGKGLYLYWTAPSNCDGVNIYYGTSEYGAINGTVSKVSTTESTYSLTGIDVTANNYFIKVVPYKKYGSYTVEAPVTANTISLFCTSPSAAFTDVYYKTSEDKYYFKFNPGSYANKVNVYCYSYWGNWSNFRYFDNVSAGTSNLYTSTYYGSTAAAYNFTLEPIYNYTISSTTYTFRGPWLNKTCVTK